MNEKIVGIQKWLGVNQAGKDDTSLKLGEASEMRNWRVTQDGAYLLHFYAYMEFFRKDLDELAEVHAAIGDVVEYGFGPVALELDVTYLHFQAQFGGYLAGAYHNLVLPGYGFLPFLYVEELGLAVDAAYVRTVGCTLLHFIWWPTADIVKRTSMQRELI